MRPLDRLPTRSVLAALSTLCVLLMLAARPAAGALSWLVKSNQPVFDQLSIFSVTQFQGKLWLLGDFPEGYGPSYWTVDGVTWGGGSTNLYPHYGHRMLEFSGQLWVLQPDDFANTTKIYKSSDGRNFTAVNSALPIGFRVNPGFVVFNGALWIIGGQDYSGNSFNDIWKSTDGAAWTRVSAGAAFEPRGDMGVAAFQNKLWVLGGANRDQGGVDVWSSPDGIAWTRNVDVIPGTVRSFCRNIAVYANQIWIVENSGLEPAEVRHSGDGVNWIHETDLDVGDGGYKAAAFNGYLWKIGGAPFWTGPAPNVRVINGFNYLTTNPNQGTITRTPDYPFYTPGSQVILRAGDVAPYKFSNWSGDAAGSANPVTVTMDRNKTVTANFSAANFTLTVAFVNGTVARSPTQPTYPSGTTVTLSATPNAGYVFSGWTGSITGSANPLAVLMNGDKSLTANFTKVKYALTTSASNGTITRSPNAPDYSAGTVVSLMPTPNAGYVFTGWTGDASGKYAPLSVVMDKAKTIQANFGTTNVKLTLTPPANGKLMAWPQPNGSGSYTRGQKVLISAIPNSGYKFSAWGGAAIGGSSPFPLIMDADKAVSASFVPIPTYTLTLTQPSTGVIKASPFPGPYREGTMVILSAIANPGNKFANWTGDAKGAQPSYSLVMNSNKTVSAAFSTPPSYSLTVVHATGTQTLTVKQNTSTAISTSIPADKAFDHWEVTAKQSDKVGVSIGNPKNASATVKLANGNATVTAVFLDPMLEVQTKDMAKGSGDKNKSKPWILIKTLNAAPLADFEFRYYFKVECSQHPNLAWSPAPPAGWSATLVDADGNGDQGGNWYVNYRFTGTIIGRSQLETPPGLLLSYACASCTWNRMNDPSSSKSATYKKTVFVPVFKNPGDASPIHGMIPGLFVDPPPAGAPVVIPEVFTLPQPTATEPPTPNVTVDMVFPGGSLALNGSFESDSLGWAKFGGDAGVVWQIAPHSLAEPAFDGNRFLQALPKGGAVEGVYFEIPESSPAFATLLGKTAVLSAWVRNPSGTAVPNSVRLALLNGSDNGSGNPALNLDDTWQFATLVLSNLTPTVEGGINKFRFAVLEASAGQNKPFQLDGVTLSLGSLYAPPSSTVKLTNTRHGVMQTRQFLPGPNFGYDPLNAKVAVGNTENDALGRLARSYLPFVDNCLGTACNPAFKEADYFAQMAKANAQYAPGNAEGLPDAGGFAYSEPAYESDQATTVIRTGEPGAAYQKGAGHTVETFYSGVSSMDIAKLGSNPAIPANRSNPVYAYKLTKDRNGNGTMEWKDGFGQVVKVASPVKEGSTQKYLAKENIYDERGNLIHVLPPMSCVKADGTPSGIANCVNPTSYDYDAENRRVKEADPDAGVTRYFYDLLGRKRLMQTAEQAARGRFSVTVYDPLGRVTAEGEYTGPIADDLEARYLAEIPDWPYVDDAYFNIQNLYYYDRMPPPSGPDRYGFGPDFRLYPGEQEGTFQNTKTRLCAVVSPQAYVDAYGQDEARRVEHVTSAAYRYDKYGRVIETYTYNGFSTNPDYKLQKNAVSYDLMGRMSESRHFDKADSYVPSRVNTFSYNAWGSLEEVRDAAGKSIARFEYYPYNQKPKSVTLDGDEADSIYVTYAYHITGDTKLIRVERPSLGAAKLLYEENLAYEAPADAAAKPRYNGDISQIKYFLAQVPAADANRQVVYGYDEINRLVSAAYEVVDGAAKANDNSFDGKYAYDLNGRFQFQRTGGKATASTGGEYAYLPGTNRLAYVNAGMSDDSPARILTGTQASPNFKYDEDGRMVQDRSRKLVVEYDYRGLPLTFAYVGADGLLRQDCNRYDGSGNRLARLEFKQSAGPASEFIVDPDASRERDYDGLTNAYNAVKAKLAAQNASPGSIFFYQVQDGGTVDGNVTVMAPLYLIDGVTKVGVAAKKVLFGSPEYWLALSGRKSMSLVRATLYTGVGNELRLGGSGTATIPVILTDLPSGLGRYSGMNEKLFQLKNHLGSTVLGASSVSGSGYDVFDYFAYGKQAKLAVGPSGADKITATFTGKELDENLGLYYFGARYLDQDLASWISPDAAREHHSLYTYGGNNPVTTVDPDGNNDAKAPPPRSAPFLERAGYYSSPGPWAKEYIFASGPKITPLDRVAVNAMGDANGCHLCGAVTPGTKSGNWVPDHQHPISATEEGSQMKLYPSCVKDSRVQGGLMSHLGRFASGLSSIAEGLNLIHLYVQNERAEKYGVSLFMVMSYEMLTSQEFDAAAKDKMLGISYD